MIDAVQALADLDATPGDIVGIRKPQYRQLLQQLARLQQASRRMDVFAIPAGAAA